MESGFFICLAFSARSILKGSMALSCFYFDESEKIIQNDTGCFVLLKRSGRAAAVGGAVDMTLASTDIRVKIGN